MTTLVILFDRAHNLHKRFEPTNRLKIWEVYTQTVQSFVMLSNKLNTSLPEFVHWFGNVILIWDIQQVTHIKSINQNNISDLLVK